MHLISTVEWEEIIGKADATNESDSHGAARAILVQAARAHWDMLPGGFNEDDVAQLANAMVAYARLLHKAGVTP